MGLSVLGMGTFAPSDLGRQVDRLSATVSHTMDVVRYLATNLRPATLDLGLVPAIEWLADDFSDRWGIVCRVDVRCDQDDLDAINATSIFRIVQESLTNIARHANASEVIIFLRTVDHMLNLRICDNGKGFDPAVVAKTSGFGLLGMRERVLALGGSMKIKTGLNEGTVIDIDIPTTGKRND